MSSSSASAPTARRPSVEALFSGTASIRKYHLTADCSALDRLRELGYDPEHHLSRVAFGTLANLAANPDGRLCRVCALERTLVSVLRRRGEEPTTFITASAQKSPGEAFTQSGSLRAGYRFDTCSDSAADRLRRIGSRTGIPVTSSTVGPILHGFVPTRTVDVLTRNLRTMVRPEVRTPPEPGAVAMVWSMFAAEPPELRAALTARGIAAPQTIDPWLLADLVFTAG